MKQYLRRRCDDLRFAEQHDRALNAVASVHPQALLSLCVYAHPARWCIFISVVINVEIVYLLQHALHRGRSPDREHTLIAKHDACTRDCDNQVCQKLSACAATASCTRSDALKQRSVARRWSTRGLGPQADPSKASQCKRLNWSISAPNPA